MPEFVDLVEGLLPIYNEMTKVVPVRGARHKNKVRDQRLTDKYRTGKSMPRYYASRHAAPIEDLTEEEKERQKVDGGGDIQVMRDSMAEDGYLDGEGRGREE